VLKHCKAGLFLGTSLRAVDGVTFQNLVLPYRRSDGRVEFPEEIKSCVNTMQMNLTEIDSPFTDMYLPRNQNIIFIRNVFIYFTPEMRARILRTITQKCLADDGLLFVSMSETAQIDSTILPPNLEKQMDGSVFYFHKKPTGGKVYG
jgi:chemotaxis protein methyltransferase CheR